MRVSRSSDMQTEADCDCNRRANRARLSTIIRQKRSRSLPKTDTMERKLRVIQRRHALPLPHLTMPYVHVHVCDSS